MGKKTKVVLDTNVIVSAFGWHGSPEDVIRLAGKGEITNFISIEMLDELGRVISYPKLNFSEMLRAEILETIFTISAIVNTDEVVNVIKNDPEDNKILECALAANAEFIITGDNHLLSLKKFREVLIVSPDDFLKMKGIAP